jgi:hypothetical protein
VTTLESGPDRTEKEAWMLPLLFAGILQAAPASAEAPLAFLWLTPTGRTAHVRSSALLAELDERLERDTDLDLEPIDAARVTECRGRLSCIVQAARPEYDRSVYALPNGTLAPYSEHQQFVRDRGLRVPTLLLILTGIESDGTDSLTGILVDTERALQFRHARDAMDREAERQLRETAVVGGGFRASVGGPDELQPVLDRLVERHLRPVLEATGHWRPYGMLRVESPVVGAGIEVDGRLVGTTEPGATRLERVRPGRRRVRVEHPEFRPFDTVVEVARQQTTTVQVELQPLPSGASRGIRNGLMWSGVLMAAAGTGITIAGIVDASDAPTVACPDCSGFRFRTFGATPPEDPVMAAEESGPLAVPLGYSLMLTGASWSIGSLLTPKEQVPWIPLVAGLAGGAAAYAISAAVNPDPYGP